MIKYGKIVCGALRVPQNYPCSIQVGERTVYNPTEEDYRAAGYLPIVESPEPTVEDGHVAEASYRVEDGKIVQYWTVKPMPTESDGDGGQFFRGEEGHDEQE